MESDTVVQIVLSLLIVVFFCFSVISTFAEIAYEEASLTKLRYMSGRPLGRLAIKLSIDRDRTITTSRILSIISNIGISMSLIIIGVKYFYKETMPWLGPLITILIGVFAIVFFAEIIPTIFAKKSPEKIAVVLAGWVIVFYYLFYPVTSLTKYLTKLFSKIFKIKEKPDISEKDLRDVVTDVYDEGAIEKDEHDLIQNSLSFDDKTINKVMTPFSKVIIAKNDMTIKEIEKIFLDNNYSRVPFLDSKTNEVIGFLLQKDFYEMLLLGKNDINEQIKPALFFPSNINASLALKRLQKFRQQMAIVRKPDTNEVVGIITVEDLVEEIVGEIEDESDAEDIELARKKKLENQNKEAETEEKANESENFEGDSVILPTSENQEESSIDSTEESLENDNIEENNDSNNDFYEEDDYSFDSAEKNNQE